MIIIVQYQNIKNISRLNTFNDNVDEASEWRAWVSTFMFS